jgi:DNA-binding transcriptional ArsR family regulator
MEKLKNIEKILKSLGNRRRLAIIKYLLRAKEDNVANIAESINLSFKATSKHLSVLRQLDIIDSRQQSLNVFYKLSETMPKIAREVIKYISNSRE